MGLYLASLWNRGLGQLGNGEFVISHRMILSWLFLFLFMNSASEFYRVVSLTCIAGANLWFSFLLSITLESSQEIIRQSL